MDHRAETEKLVADGAEQDLARHIIEFNPRQAEHYLFAATPADAEAKAMAQAVLHPDPIPWPPGTAPTPDPSGNPTNGHRSAACSRCVGGDLHRRRGLRPG